jgi:FtsZ-binding cell division protein ZapB
VTNIDELFRLVTQLVGRVDRIEVELERVAERVEALRATDAEAQRRLALLEREHSEWKKSTEVWGQRAWSLLILFVTAVVRGGWSATSSAGS